MSGFLEFPCQWNAKLCFCVYECMCVCVSMCAFKYLCMCWGHRSTLHVQHLLLLPQQWDYKHISPGFCVCMCVQCVFRGSKSGGLCTVRTLTAEHDPRHFKVLFLRSLLSDSAPMRMLLPRKQTSMVFVAELGHLIEVNALLTLTWNSFWFRKTAGSSLKNVAVWWL